MPICNEDVPRVFAGLRATYESLAATGALDRFRLRARLGGWRRWTTSTS